MAQSNDSGADLRALREQVDALRAGNRMMSAFLEYSTDAIQISDRNMVTVFVNRSYEVLTGIRREEQVGVPVSELVERELIAPVSACAIVARTGDPCTIVQTFPRTGRSAHVSCQPVYDEQGQIEFYICNDRDLDEIRSLKSELRQVTGLKDRYLDELEILRSQLPGTGGMVVADEAMLRVMSRAARAARVDSPVLVLGQTGVGKDELVRFIHQNSGRAGAPLVSINCGAIPESLFESEVFGHEGRAPAGPDSRPKAGLLESASHGTVFLDKVGELSLNMQAKLVHVLQSQSFLRVGGSRPIQLDVRIAAATDQDLEQLVRQGLFREDLFYRLNVVSIRIPPLRERLNDVIPLAQHFLEQYNEKYAQHKSFSPGARFALLHCRWEGNVRQLKNAVEQAVIMTDGDVIGPESLALSVDVPLPGAELREDMGLDEMLERVELQYLNQYYETCGSIREAARRLKMSPTTFLRHRTHLTEKYGG